MDIRTRKQDHVDLTLGGACDYAKTSGFERFDFWHNALPEIDYDETDASVEFLGRRFGFPLFISSMTGGYEGATAVNRILAEIAEARNLPMGVGSQRAMIEKPELEGTFRVVREAAPTAFIAANIGGVQLVSGWSADKTFRLIESIRADALIIHLNPLQEMVQPEGDRRFKGVLDGIARMVATCGRPVIVKETGAGFSPDTAMRLKNVGVSVLDVSGAGGTSWAKVEARRRSDADHALDEWGIPTATSLQALSPLVSDGFRIIASGGIRTETDIAKSICLGADMAAMAQPLLTWIKQGGRASLEAELDRMERRFRTILLLLGARKPSDLDSRHLRTL